jgi:small subunit ribosomal protein S2
MKKTDPAELLSYGVHLGHKKTKVHPKSRKYIYKLENGTSIIDLFKTAELLDAAKAYMSELAKDGKVVLFIGTKKVAREALNDYSSEHGLLHMTNKWVGGFLTNFSEVSKNIKRMNDLRKEQSDGAWSDFPKHERNAMEKKLNRIASIYGGVSTMDKLPDVIFMVDVRKEKNALTEAMQLNIPTIAITDTNVDPDDVTYPIPANDDAVTSVKFIIDAIMESYLGKAESKKGSTSKETKDSEAMSESIQRRLLLKSMVRFQSS